MKLRVERLPILIVGHELRDPTSEVVSRGPKDARGHTRHAID